MVTNLLLSPRASKENEGTGEPEEKRYLLLASVTNAAFYRKETEGAWDHALCMRVCACMYVYVCAHTHGCVPVHLLLQARSGRGCRASAPPSPRWQHRGAGGA